eukprot:s3677_g8.t1
MDGDAIPATQDFPGHVEPGQPPGEAGKELGDQKQDPEDSELALGPTVDAQLPGPPVSWEQSTDAADISLEPAAPSHPTGVFPAETAETQAAVVLPTAPLLDGHGGEDVQAQLPKAEEELPSAADTQLPGDHPDESKKSMASSASDCDTVSGR